MIDLIKKDKKFLLLLFLFSFIIRGLFFEFFLGRDKNYWTADSGAYHNLAVEIAKGNGIVNSDQTPHFFRLPGYSLFLSLGYKLFNFDENKTLWLQVFLASFIPLFVFCLSLVLFPASILLAKISSFYAAIHLGFVMFSGLLMSEPLFILFFLLFLILFFSKFYFSAGIFLGIASLVRPVGPYVICLSIFILLFYQIGFSEKIKKSLLMFVGWFLIVSWWLLRNYFLTGVIFFHTLPGKHFLYHSAAYIVMNKDNISYQQAKKKLVNELGTEKLNELQFCQNSEKLAFKYFKKYPLLFFKHGLINVIKTTFAPFSEEFSFINKSEKKLLFFLRIDKKLIPIFCLELIFILFIFIGFLGFLIGAFYNKNQIYVLINIFPFIMLFIFITLSAGFARLRLPIEPLFFIPAFAFWLKRVKR